MVPYHVTALLGVQAATRRQQPKVQAPADTTAEVFICQKSLNVLERKSLTGTIMSLETNPGGGQEMPICYQDLLVGCFVFLLILIPQQR